MKAINEIEDYPNAVEFLRSRNKEVFKTKNVNEFTQLMSDYEMKHLELLDRIATALEKIVEIN